VRRRVDWAAADTVPGRAEVLRLQGVPGDAAVTPRIAALHATALAAFLETAEPRAVMAEIGRAEFAAVHRGEGRNAAETPLEGVVAGAERLALFAATVGPGVSARIRDLFATNQPALATMLDAVASAAADRLPELLGAGWMGPAGAAAADGACVLAYSPGYCGWHVSGQRALFAALEPAGIGVTLNASCLMEPLKSVSGVLVAGPARIHRFVPGFGFCPECREKPCRARMASLSRD